MESRRVGERKEQRVRGATGCEEGRQVDGIKRRGQRLLTKPCCSCRRVHCCWHLKGHCDVACVCCACQIHLSACQIQPALLREVGVEGGRTGWAFTKQQASTIVIAPQGSCSGLSCATHPTTAPASAHLPNTAWQVAMDWALMHWVTCSWEGRKGV